MKMFVYIMTMFVYTLAGQGVLTNIGTTELDEECSGVALIYLIERMLASFPPHDDLCQLGNVHMIGTQCTCTSSLLTHNQAWHRCSRRTGCLLMQVPMSGRPAPGLLMLIESRLSNDESAPGCTTRVLNLHAPHAQLEWLVPFMPFSWRTSLPLLSNPERNHRHASIRQHACVRTRRGPQHACTHTGRA